MKKALGIDIGGTKICYGIIGENGEKLSDVKKIPTPKQADEIVKTLKQIIEEYQDSIDAVGISSAGAVNLENKKVTSSTPNLPEGYNLIDFSTLSQKKVFIENDANCAAWTEAKIGAAQGANTVLMITIGTGIGGGVVSDNRLFRGSAGNALEVGSMKIFADKRHQCSCGRYDCWEFYASGTGLKNCAVIEAYPEFETSIFSDKKQEDLTTYDIIDGIKKGDEFSIKVHKQWQYYMFIGLVGLTNIFNPDCIVISGGMCEFIDIKNLEKQINDESVVTPTAVKLAKTKNDAGMIGAALLAIA
jgi:glucokinase